MYFFLYCHLLFKLFNTIFKFSKFFFLFLELVYSVGKKNAMIFQSDFHSTGKLVVQTVKNSHSFARRPQRPQRKLNYLGWPQSWPLCYSQSFHGTIYLITCLSYLTYETLVLESTEIDDRQPITLEALNTYEWWWWPEAEIMILEHY